MGIIANFVRRVWSSFPTSAGTEHLHLVLRPSHPVSPLVPRPVRCVTGIALISFSLSANVAAAPHQCIIQAKDNLVEASRAHLVAKYCTALLTASVATEEGILIEKLLSAEEWSEGNKDRWARIMAKGMIVLAERNLCVTTAQTIRTIYLSRFNDEPKCSGAGKK